MFKKQTNFNQHTSNNQPVEVNIGDRFPLTIKRLGINGEGIGYYKRKICFVPNALPEEVVVVEVTESNAHFLRGKIHSIRQASEYRIKPRDSYANNVGGFELEHLEYSQQLKFKRDLIQQSLEKFQPRGFKHYQIKQTIGMDNPFEYRNKAQFQVRLLDGHVAAGLFKTGSHDLVDLPTCAVQIPVTMKVMRQVVKIIEALAIPIYNEEDHSGIIKTLVVRVAQGTGEIQLTFITNSPKLPHKRELLEQISTQLPEVTSIMQNINKGESPLVWGEQTVHLAGEEAITETIGDLKFRLSARAFLQLNPTQTKVLYAETAKALDLNPTDNLVDAYAGIGTIGLTLADQVDQVRGMEVIKDAVDDANFNAKQNNIDNVSYEVGTAEELLPKWLDDGFFIDALVVDPPRAGLDQQLIESILNARPEKFVYVSCNPSTLARDLVTLTRDYKVEYMQPVDMMPQTPKCEVVVKLVRI
ncbi:23S rRNA (uracil(1939)-C(5))-methyltransferase RlmD [Paucilactobacillus kaifaensis]|uniref:23S rRNA (uracil(1939)-C(5))-methyltransferase RlmD n=1 Tax=Paucilactobacillus kaifaensis TaxID=2559921 RepID=UPI0010F5FE05|nr:23S rRNA (uracil(1939)-C(5))-methyltransferase RlmD [Paucilactobacillus kaifaensis]